MHRPLEADDTRVTRDGLAALGVMVRIEGDRWIIDGCAGKLAGGARLALGESGTSMRLLAAVAALGVAPSLLDGAPRLRERPLQELATALVELGGEARLGPSAGGLPLEVGGRPLRGGCARVGSARSSQFASALLLVGPRLPAGLDLTLAAPVVSLPYVRLTAQVLSDFGVRVEHPEEHRWRVPPQDYRAREYVVEGDHSSASYFLAAACVLGGRVRVRGLLTRSAQPDARLGSLLEQLGCAVCRGDDWIEVRGSGRIPGFDFEMSDAPDLVPTLAVLGLFADHSSVVRGVAHLRHKESDRLELLAANLRRMGRAASAEQDRLVIGPPPVSLKGGLMPTASDHRIAMAFAVAGLRLRGMSVDDPACVSKSHPGFWSQLERLEGP